MFVEGRIAETLLRTARLESSHLPLGCRHLFTFIPNDKVLFTFLSIFLETPWLISLTSLMMFVSYTVNIQYVFEKLHFIETTVLVSVISLWLITIQIRG